MRASGCSLLLLITTMLVGACEYPQYEFVPDQDDGGDDTFALDGSLDTHIGDSSDREDADVLDSLDSDLTLDSSSETLVTDSGSVFDSGARDSGLDTSSGDVAPETISTKGCAGSTHVFCSDFDSVSSPESGWTDLNLLGGGTNLLDESLASSPPASYLATIPASSDGEASASLNKDFTLGSATALLRAEMLVRLDAATNPQENLMMKLSRVGSGNGVEVSIGPGGLVMNIVGTASSGSFPLLLAKPGVWMRIRLEVVLATGTGGSAQVFIDGTSITNQMGIATTTSTAATARLVVGLYQSSAPVSAAKANFDDVTFDTP